MVEGIQNNSSVSNSLVSGTYLNSISGRPEKKTDFSKTAKLKLPPESSPPAKKSAWETVGSILWGLTPLGWTGCSRKPETQTAPATNQPADGISANITNAVQAYDLFPFISLYPVKPGLSWTYKYKLEPGAVSFHYYMDFENPEKARLFVPQQHLQGHEGRLVVRIASEKISFGAEHSLGTVEIEDPTPRKFFAGAGKTLLGRINLKEVSENTWAVWEIRPVLPELLEIIKENNLSPEKTFDFKYLTFELPLPDDLNQLKNETAVLQLPPVKQLKHQNWYLVSGGGFEKHHVPAGDFLCVPTTLAYNHLKQSYMDLSYHALGKGLIKWVQLAVNPETGGVKTNATLELESYDLSPGLKQQK